MTCQPACSCVHLDDAFSLRTCLALGLCAAVGLCHCLACECAKQPCMSYCACLVAHSAASLHRISLPRHTRHRECLCGNSEWLSACLHRHEHNKQGDTSALHAYKDGPQRNIACMRPFTRSTWQLWADSDFSGTTRCFLCVCRANVQVDFPALTGWCRVGHTLLPLVEVKCLAIRIPAHLRMFHVLDSNVEVRTCGLA